MIEKKQSSVKLNMIMNAMLTMSSVIFPLITFPYACRILLPEGNGKVTFAVSIVTYFSMFAQLGIPTYGVSVCAKVRDDKKALSRVVHELLFINAIMCVVSYLVFGVALASVPKLANEKNLYMVVSVVIILNTLGVEWLYKALEKYTYITIRSVIFKLIALIAMFMLVHEKEDYVIYGGITIFATSASNILNFLNLRKHIYIRPLGEYQIKRHLKLILVFFSMSVATTIYTNMDTVMLGFMKDDTQVGYYGAAVKIKGILVSLVTSASTVLLPRASYYVEKGMLDEFFRILKKTMHFVVLVALPMTIYFIIYAKEGIYFLSGLEYKDSIIPMQIIMPTLVLIGITNVIGIQMLVPIGKEKKVLQSVIIGAIVDLLLNTIPRYGASGAALGTLVAEIVVLIWQCIVIREMPVKIFEDIPIYKILVGSGMGVILSIWVKKLEVGLFFILCVSAISFFCAYGLTLLILKETLVCELSKTLAKKVQQKIQRIKG